MADSRPASSLQRQPAPPVLTLTPESAARLRDYAVQQLLRAARELALTHLERGARIIEGRAHPICDHCRAMLSGPDDIWGHRRECPAARTLGFARELTLWGAAGTAPQDAQVRPWAPDEAADQGDPCSGEDDEACALPGCAHGRGGAR